MTIAAQLLRDARERTIAAGSARIWTASFDDSAWSGAPNFESTGVIDFRARRALLEGRMSGTYADRLNEVATEAGGEGPFDRDFAHEYRHVSLFIGDQEYSLAEDNRHWVGGGVSWWERPLLSLDLLHAVSDDVRARGKGAVRGCEATEYEATIVRQELARVDPTLARKLVGRRGKQNLIVRIWLDPNGRVVRIWRAITPKRDEELWWTAIEFWDFGIETNLETPPDELVLPPATLRDIVRDMWRMRRKGRT